MEALIQLLAEWKNDRTPATRADIAYALTLLLRAETKERTEIKAEHGWEEVGPGERNSVY